MSSECDPKRFKSGEGFTPDERCKWCDSPIAYTDDFNEPFCPNEKCPWHDGGILEAMKRHKDSQTDGYG